MINLIIFGPPGSGKGTQAKILSEKYNLKHLSTGDLFRSNMKNDTELGKLAKSYIDKGDLVPDEVTTAMVKDFLESNRDVSGFIFDGYPRTTTQAHDLDILVEEVLNAPITVTLSLIVDDEELTKRILERGKTSGRKDDSDISIIQNRVKEYEAKTAPVAEYYKQQEKYKEVDGIGTIEEINQKLSQAIDSFI